MIHDGICLLELVKPLGMLQVPFPHNLSSSALCEGRPNEGHAQPPLVVPVKDGEDHKI